MASNFSIYVEKTQNSALGNLFLLGIIASVIIGLFAAIKRFF